MLNDIKLALRGFAKTRGFTAIAVATLALAIGANSAVFSLINALLVRPLPYQDPSRIALIWEQFKTQGLERIPCFAAGIPRSAKGISKRHRARRVQLSDIQHRRWRCSGAYFAARWYRRRYFHCSGSNQLQDARLPARKRESVTTMSIVISERLWKRRFNSDPCSSAKRCS